MRIKGNKTAANNPEAVGGTPLKSAYTVSLVTITVNVLLAAAKLLAGIVGSSGAMVSDAVHTASDVFTTVIAMIGIRISGKEKDKQHQYGHERFECVASVLLAAVLFATGLGIGISGIQLVTAVGEKEIVVPGGIALAAALLSVAVKEAMYWYTRAAAKKISSGALMADAWHHRSDALSSVGAFVGILGARMGLPVLDPISSVVICAFIIKAAWDVFVDAVNKMVDRACDDDTVEKLRSTVMGQPGVEGIADLRTRQFGAKLYVDIEICVDGQLSIMRGHDIAERVHDSIEADFPQVKHCMVHVEPN